jgi:hypothetical protein
MEGGVVQLLRRRLGKPDHERGGVLRHHGDAGEVGTRGGVDHRIGEGAERKPDVFCGYWPAVLPAGARPQVEAPGQRVDALPALGQRRSVGGGVDRRAARRQVGEPLEDLVADVASHRFLGQRRQQMGRITRCGDDDRAAAGAVATVAAAPERGRRKQDRGNGACPSPVRTHPDLEL